MMPEEYGNTAVECKAYYTRKLNSLAVYELLIGRKYFLLTFNISISKDHVIKRYFFHTTHRFQVLTLRIFGHKTCRT